MSAAFEPREFWGVIPKGTEIFNGNPYKAHNVTIEKTTRTIRAKFRTGMMVWDAAAPEFQKYLGDAQYNSTDSNFGDRLATWGDHYDRNFVDTQYIKEVEAPKKAERKDTGPTMTQLLQPGSKWKLTEPASLDRVTIVQKTNARNVSWNEKLYVPGGELSAGTEFTVTKKPQAADSWRSEGRSGLYVEVTVGGQPYTLKVTDLKNAEALEDAEAQPAYVIQDSVTGQFYKASEYVPDANGVWGHSPTTMVDKFTGARKWKRLSDVRVAVLNLTGYFEGLPGSGNLPEWMGGSAQMEYKDVPRTWRIAKVNKLTKTVMETMELVDTLDRAWRLRDLTMKYGSGVRTMYSVLEKKETIKEFPAMLVFTVDENQRNQWWADGMTPEQKAEIDDALGAFDKKDIKRSKGASDYAIAVKDIDTAVMIKLQYSGELKCHLLDLDKLQEVVK